MKLSKEYMEDINMEFSDSNRINSFCVGAMSVEIARLRGLYFMKNQVTDEIIAEYKNKAKKALNLKIDKLKGGEL